ncbi:S8/S53 family peptidase [Thermopolyspora sp. NPDC052614]|uniref:S8/S53 family peptidase n=1 Tax=Thermopolyspora sp. NPDC052614 TaxID=3155682 RepID=UPI0034293EC3
MTTTPPESGDGDARFWEQLRLVREAGIDVEVGPPGVAPGSGLTPGYVYERGCLLIRDRVVADVSSLVPGAEVIGSPLPGVTKVRIDEPVPEAMARLDTTMLAGRPGRGLVSPNHLMFITPVNLCPGDEPLAVAADTAPFPAHAEGADGQDVSVLVIDTGLLRDVEDPDYIAAHPWLAGVDAVDGGYDQRPGQNGRIRHYTGHGTFVAGVLRCVAPGASVAVSNALVNVGAILEDRLGAVLLDALPQDGPWPDVISLSAGAKTWDGRPPIGLDPFIRRLSSGTGTVLVAAAGNHGEDVPFWPAAYAGPAAGAALGMGTGPIPGVVSVGALRDPENGVGRACFSNHGDWVSVYAPGERLINAYAQGVYEYLHSSFSSCRYASPALYQGCTCVTPSRSGSLSGAGPADQDKFEGMAAWSGTSFATPIVAARIAALTSRIWRETGVRDARAAAERLLASLHVMEDCADGLPLPVLP